MRPPRVALLAISIALLPRSASADIAGEPSLVHAITQVRVVVEPGASPVSASIVVRDGRIELVGTDIPIPPEAIVHEMPGRIVYPGLIEPYLRVSSPDDSTRLPEGVRHENARVRAEVRALDRIPLDDATLAAMRGSGYTTAFVAPDRGVFRGTGSIVALGDEAVSDQVLTADFAQVFAFERGHWPDPEYPNSLMGAIALARQVLYDTGWQRDVRQEWTKDPGEEERPVENAALRALEPVVERSMPLFMESESVNMLPRALAIAREFRLAPVVISGGSDEYRRIGRVPSWLREAGARLIVAVNFPEAPTWDEDDERASIELDVLRHWERAPANPGVLEGAGVEFAVTTQGLAERADVLPALRQAIELGLSPRAALASLTTVPARILGIDGRVGTLQAGKDANLLIATSELFDRGTVVEEVWIDGVRYGPDPKRALPQDLVGKWDLEIASPGGAARSVRVEFENKQDGFVGKVVPSTDVESAEQADAPKPPTPPLRDVELTRGVLTFVLPEGVWEGGEAHVTLESDGAMLQGSLREDDRPRRVLARQAPKAVKRYENDRTILSQSAPAWPPVASRADAPRSVHIRHATIWTCGPAGVLEDADLVITDGTIRGVGPNLATPAGAAVVDATGMHLTPGLVDCHSHSSISGGINEGTNSCTSEVRIQDVVNPDSPAIYRELAGGLTVSNLLHGSANTIGGQNAVIKLRWGQPAEELLFVGAPPGIKCALGENVKQSNWGDDFKTRYPQTRMGVEQFLRDRYDAAREYQNEWASWRKRRKGAPPRRDLQLDALGEILDGERFVHCHAYRSDEIIMYMRVAEDFGFRIRTFQHVLEGYKCANEMAAHGAGASAFSDWWSYKYEVIDAIPYAGKMMWERGVLTSFNSDSSELSRRMNLEAAKAVKYGGVPEEEALKFVTANPARQLGIDGRVGSLEPGKDADFVLWTASPLSDMAIADQTWIDGVRRFSRAQDRELGKGASELRERLLEKVSAHRRATQAGKPGETQHPTFGELWERERSGWSLRRGECVSEFDDARLAEVGS